MTHNNRIWERHINQERIRRRQLPHWDVPGAAYFVTTCLEGSIPAQGLLEIESTRSAYQHKSRPAKMTQEAWQMHQWKKLFQCREKWLDLQPARRDLVQPVVAEQVVRTLLFFAGERYDLLAFVIMPSHVHWVFQPLESWIATRAKNEQRTPREQILYSINRYSATQCNKLANSTGTFWQNESYDHWIRDIEALERIVHYIEANPVKAGHVEQPDQWQYSSAWFRKHHGVEFGMPLCGVK